MEALSVRNYISMCPFVFEISIRLPQFRRDNAGTRIGDFAYDHNEMGALICP